MRPKLPRHWLYPESQGPADGNQHILIQLLVHLVSFLEHVATIRTFAFEEVVSTCVEFVCLAASYYTVVSILLCLWVCILWPNRTQCVNSDGCKCSTNICATVTGIAETEIEGSETPIS